MDGDGALRREAKLLGDVLRQNFRPAVVTPTGTVIEVERDSNRAARSARVRLADGGEVSVPLLGQDVRVGQGVQLERDINRPTSPGYRFVGVLDPQTPFPGLEGDFSVDPPTWLTPAITSRALPPTAGGQAAEVAVHLRETPEAQGPRETAIYWRLAGAAEWQVVKVPNVGGQDADLEVTLPGTYPLGTTLDVYAVTHTQGTQASPPGEVRTHTVVGDLTTPSQPVGVTVDLSINLTAKINLPTPSQPLVFDHWEVVVAGDGAGGAGGYPGLLPRTYEERGSTRLVSLPQPGPIYLRVREVTRSGRPGPYWPSSGYSGPYNVVANDTVIDTTPPPVPTLASAVASVGFDPNGDVRVTITATLAAYTKPADFATFVYSFFNGSVWYDRGSQEASYPEDGVREGTQYRVRVQAVDRAGNRSAYSNEVAVTTPTVAAPAKPGSPPTLRPVPRGIVVSWVGTTPTTGTGPVAQYDLQRSANGGVAWADLPPVAWPGTSYVDAGLAAGSYVYRYRARNANGNPGPYSDASASAQPAPVGTTDLAAGQIDANTVIAHGSITAPLLTALLILTNEIRASNPGKITAANGQIVLDSLGLSILNRLALRFVGADGISTLGPYNHLGDDGIWFQSLTEMGWYDEDDGRAAKMSFPDGLPAGLLYKRNDGSAQAMFREDGEIIVYDNSGGNPRRKLEFVPFVGTALWTLGGNANTDYDKAVADFGVAGSVAGVMLRGGASVGTGGGNLYVYAAGGNQEGGGYHTDAVGSQSRPFVMPFVPVSGAGLIRARANVAFSFGLGLIGYWR